LLHGKRRGTHLKSKITLIGAGLVGRGWGIVFAKAGYEVTLYDISDSILEKALEEIKQNLTDMKGMGLLANQSEKEIYERITLETDLEKALEHALYVQESTTEDPEKKIDILSKIDAIVAKDVVIASSTSAILPTIMGESLAGKERFLVSHPVNPPYLIPFVEIVPSQYTLEKYMTFTKNLMKEIGQVPIELKTEKPGFVLNRLQVALVNEAISLVNEGVATVEDVDAAVCHGLGLRWSFMGPFETIDLNAPNGVGDYLHRFDKMYQIFSEMKAQAPFDERLIEKIESQRRSLLNHDELEQRRMWRDRTLMSVVNFKQTLDSK